MQKTLSTPRVNVHFHTWGWDYWLPAHAGFSRTKDQMIQAARSGVQNIAEDSMASATSKKMELKLTQVARASLEELKLDYEDFLRQRGLRQWERNHPLRQKLINQRCQTADDVAGWIANETKQYNRSDTFGHSKSKNSKKSLLECPHCPQKSIRNYQPTPSLC